MLPFARSGPGGAPLLTALFTATSAVCVTGLIVVDTPTYWSGFGQFVILLLFQIGGFGIMTGATLLGLLVTRNLRLGHRLLAQAETNGMSLGDVREVLMLVFTATLIVEAAVAVLLFLSFHFDHGQPLAEAAWNGVFHSVSAFNNAGFSTYSDNLIGFVADPLVILPIVAAIIIGGLGFPVIYELRRRPREPATWSIHTKITLFGSVILLAGGFLLTLIYEWANQETFGPLSVGGKLLAAFTHSAMTRTAGFNSVDVGAMTTETLAVSYVLMMIGGGSAGTAGGIKVTTFFLLGFVVWAEIRGEQDATVFRRRICPNVQRQALTVVLMAVGLVGIGTLVLLSVSAFPLEVLLFEAISAFATVGLSTGITAKLPSSGLAVLIVLMFVGRVGTVAVATALALQTRRTPYRYPEERPIVG
jgi:trk system potassium uptake protein TrkH